MALSVGQIGSAHAQLEEIIVTAQKREQRLQDTPIAISAFSGEDLSAKGTDNISQLGDFTPNVQIDSSVGLSGSNNTSSIYIRGIGQPDFLGTSDPGVGVYLDGVYIARSTGGVLDLLDIERVEVLRGPQGTLFGRNTIGGAVSIISKKPGDVFEATAEITAGNHDRVDAKASLNIPLVPNRLYSRLNFMTRNSEGTGRFLLTGDRMGGDDTISGRGMLRLVATDDLEFNLSFDATQSKDEPPIQRLLQIDSTPATLVGLYNATVGMVTGVPYDSSFMTSRYDTSLGTGYKRSSLDIWGASLTADWTLAPVKIKSITAFRTWRGTFGRDNDHSPLVIIQQAYDFKQEQFSEELNFSGSNFEDRLKWVIGAYYFKEDGKEFSDVPIIPDAFMFTGIPTSGLGRVVFNNSNWAVFGQATFDITKRLALTAGWRYTHETKKINVNQMAPQLPGSPFLLGVRDAEATFSAATPKAALQYRLTDDFMIYGSYSKGFKSGGFVGRYTRPAPAPISFNPEKATTYELGFKSEFLDSRLRINSAGFYTKYKDIQIVVFEAAVPVTRNAAEGEIKGFETEVTAVPFDRFVVTASVGYLDAEYTEIDPGDFAGTVVPITLSSKFVNTPEWSWSASAQYTFPLFDVGDLTLRADYSFKSTTANDASNAPVLMQDSVGLLNARASFAVAGGKWELALFGRNLTDEHYLVTGTNSPSLGIIDGVYGRPREWGVTAKAHF